MSKASRMDPKSSTRMEREKIMKSDDPTREEGVK